MKFEDFNLSDEILRAVKKLGFEAPTVIQEKAIPAILERKDVIGESATGSGKTLAFGVGIIEHCKPKGGLQALVLSPTRELVEQVKNAIQSFSTKKLKFAAIYGGVNIDPQIDALKSTDVVVGTPGRLLDHLQRQTINLSKIKILVLDEADRMLDMGFIEDVERIISQCPKDRQTLFFSATISSRIKELSNTHMKDPLQVAAEKMVDPSKLTQYYYDIERNQKLSLLVHLLEKEDASLVMVFCNTRNTTEFVVQNLKANRIDAIAIHGGMTQNKRLKTIDNFNKAKMTVLVCTDVAARGLHIDNVSHVYNYEIPNDSTDYVHRIGRTARAGEKGKVINLLCSDDHDNFQRILLDYRDFKIIKSPKPNFKKVFAKKPEFEHRGGFRGGKRFGGSGRGGPRRGGPRGGGPRKGRSFSRRR